MTAVLFITRYRVDRAQAGRRYRKELDFVHRAPFVSWFSSFGVINRRD